MEYIIGILLLISFIGLAVYAVRGGNLMMGMLIMAIVVLVEGCFIQAKDVKLNS